MSHAIAGALRRYDIDVITATEAGSLGTPDEVQLAHAHATRRVMVTEDSDYLRLHSLGREHHGIAYCKQGTRSIGEIIDALVLIYEAVDADGMRNHVEYM